ncbi:hypothetical protein U1Q18_050921 [Sarracenia purpurea var. burkii]
MPNRQKVLDNENHSKAAQDPNDNYFRTNSDSSIPPTIGTQPSTEPHSQLKLPLRPNKPPTSIVYHRRSSPSNQLHEARYVLQYNLEKVPQPYVPYAELALSILKCLYELRDVKESIRIIQRFAESNHSFTLPDIFTLDPVISPLFSSYVFSDNDPPVRLVRELAKIPEKEISIVSGRVEKLLKHRHFPRRYSRFAKCLLGYLNREYLGGLKSNLGEIQRVVASSIPQGEYLEDPDPDYPAQSISKPDNGSIVSTLSNDDRDANISPQKIYVKNVRDLLPPEIFSESDPYAYIFAKAMKLSKHFLREADFWMAYFLDHDRFPQRYTPYAELASSLLSCLVSLENIEQIINVIQRSDKYNYSYHRRKLFSILDPELSKLFTDDIFIRTNRMPRILNKLLEIPDNEISNMAMRLQKLLDEDYLPTRYVGYH